jgi:hypothetical protein
MGFLGPARPEVRLDSRRSSKSAVRPLAVRPKRSRPPGMRSSATAEKRACAAGARQMGLCWQITCVVLTKATTDPDPAVTKRAFDAMMQMKKIDIAAIEAARRS